MDSERDRYGYEPDTQLIPQPDDDAPRFCLSGRPVNAGDFLQLHTAEGHWLLIRIDYEHRDGNPPVAVGCLSLAVPFAARELLDAPEVQFPLPPRAILRWPARASHRSAGRPQPPAEPPRGDQSANR